MVDRPVVFVGSSSEGLAIAEALQAELQSNQLEIVVWKRLFEPGEVTLQALHKKANDFDFAVLVLSGDDILESRGTSSKMPRDNVLFEMGLFVGCLGPDRTFYLYKGTERPKVPTDLAGTTGVEYTEPGTYGLRPALSPACQQLRSRFHALGPRDRTARCPALRIDFSYLPDATLESRGWVKRHNLPNGDLPQTEFLDDRRFGRSLAMKGKDGAYMDYFFSYLVEATDLEFVVKGDGWVVYPIIDLKHAMTGRTKERVYLRLSDRDHDIGKFNDEEWWVPHHAVRIEHDWYSIVVNVPKLVSTTFETEGWRYLRLRGLRLRGHTTLSFVAIYS